MHTKPTSKFVIRESEKYKVFRSKEFNYDFNKITGYHTQWGATKEEDSRSPYGPVIADIEVVSMCKGPGGKLCPFCYKSNTPQGHYMSLEDYKVIFSKLPQTLTQIAFGADADCSLNPDLFDIMHYTRDNGIVPNITVADISEETAKKLARLSGAVSVSWYGMHTKKDYCYDSIEKLTRNAKESGTTLKQTNMHYMLSKESLPYIDELIQDIKTDSRLKDLNAVVFLSLKQKGRGTKFQGCTDEEFKSVVDRMMAAGIGFGFDSCSQPKWVKSIKGHEKEKEYIQMSESCESFSQSLYVNERGVVVPCSFMENMQWDSSAENNSTGWNLLDDSIKNEDEFVARVWNSNRALTFSEQASKCASCGKGCQVYNV